LSWEGGAAAGYLFIDVQSFFAASLQLLHTLKGHSVLQTPKASVMYTYITLGIVFHTHITLLQTPSQDFKFLMDQNEIYEYSSQLQTHLFRGPLNFPFLGA